MGIEYKIDHERRLVWATGRETLTGDDVMSYQRDVWSSPAVKGYNELMDMSGVEHFDLPTAKQLKELAGVSAAMDAQGSSKFAIVAPRDEAFGVGRMYEMYRRLDRQSTKEVGVFRTLDEAFAFLGLTP